MSSAPTKTPLYGPNAISGRILVLVATFDAFTENNDPYGEHDFGSFDFGEQTIFWKIDCFDRYLSHASPYPTNPFVTTRVLTVMLAEEYFRPESRDSGSGAPTHPTDARGLKSIMRASRAARS